MDERTCIIEGCEKSRKYQRRVCPMHATRIGRYGDPNGFKRRPSDSERLLASFDQGEGCWEWKRGISDTGYGSFATDDRRALNAHRAVYEFFKGPIPAGLQLDHLCRNRACVNPDHLEPVTPRTNTLRGVGPSAENAMKTHCDHGHEFTAANTYHRPDRPHTRACRACKADRERSRQRRLANVRRQLV